MNPFFNIREEKVLTTTGIDIAYKKAIINEETNKPISIVGENYQVVKNEDLSNSLKKVLDDAGIKYRTLKTKLLGKRNQKFYQKFNFPEIEINVGTHETQYGTVPDNIQMMIELHNSYDGSTKWGFELGAYRLVCLNGLRVYDKMFRINSMHYEDNDEFLMIGIETAIKMFKNDMFESFEKMKEINFEHEMAITLLEKLELGKRYDKIVRNELEQREKNKKLKNGWDFYNMMTWITTHVIEQRNMNLARDISKKTASFISQL